MQTRKTFYRTALVTMALAYLVVTLGAYTRLSDAGLGCPDWPGCYGQLLVPTEGSAVENANTLYPDRPLHRGKAWKEMIHRYAAGTLGLLILALAVAAWRRRRQPGQPLVLPAMLFGLVLFQAALGMWTVTWLLKPVVVTAHLLGGMTILALLAWLVGGYLLNDNVRPNLGLLLPWCYLAVFVLAVQIALGGWTSANYAALICPEFPTCRGGVWWPPVDFKDGFVLWRGLGTDYEGGILDAAARTAIHLSHRLGAVLALLVLAALALRAWLSADHVSRVLGAVLALLLLTQIGLGIANVLLLLPLPVAVAHNATAALLLLTLMLLLRRVYSSRRIPGG